MYPQVIGGDSTPWGLEQQGLWIYLHGGFFPPMADAWVVMAEGWTQVELLSKAPIYVV